MEKSSPGCNYLGCRTQRWLISKVTSGGGREDIVGKYSCSTSDTVWNHDGSWSTTANAQRHTKSLYGPWLPYSVHPQQGWRGRGWGEWSVVRDKKRLRPKAVTEQDKGNNFWCLCRQCIGGSLDICLQPNHFSPCSTMSWEPVHAPLASALLPTGARISVLGERKAHLKRMESAWNWPTGLLP